MGESERILVWRIQDGDWFHDLPVIGTVPYEDAERIVLAIRHRTLHYVPEGAIATRDASSISSTDKVGVSSGEYPGDYRVVGSNADGGYELYVQIVNKDVELLTMRGWIY